MVFEFSGIAISPEFTQAKSVSLLNVDLQNIKPSYAFALGESTERHMRTVVIVTPQPLCRLDLSVFE